LLAVINILSIITLEKYWKNGIRFVFKKKKNESFKNYQPLPDIATSAFEVHDQNPLQNLGDKKDRVVVKRAEKIL